MLSYTGYIETCGPEGYGFASVSVINRVSVLADFCRWSHKKGMA